MDQHHNLANNVRILNEWFSIEANTSDLASCIGSISHSYGQDVVQETYLRAYHAAMRPEFILREETLGGWIYRIARNYAFNLNRSSGNRMKREVMFLNGRPQYSSNDEGNSQDRKRLARLVLEEMGKLEGVRRELVRLHFVEGESYESLAILFGMNKNTIKTNIYRGKMRIRERVSELYHEAEIPELLSA